jgi:two-component system, OmpR family, phosphate regulon sensor histidine kinase PhoR
MRSSTLTKIIFFFTILIAVIVIIQLFWLNKLYSFEQKQFTTSVIKVARGVLEDLPLSDDPEVSLQKIIETPDPNTFLVRIDSIPPKDSLLYYMNLEMEDFDLFIDCNLKVYDSKMNNYVYEGYLPAAGSHNFLNTAYKSPLFKRDYSFIEFYFPHRDKYILHEMTLWIVISIILLALLIALGASVVYLYKQKFLNEMQNDFIRNITHEFQTPLTTLKLGLDLISKPAILGKPDKLEKYTTLMKTQTDYLHRHIENLVKVIKTNKDALRIDKEEVHPGELIHHAMEQLQMQAEEKDAIIELKLDPANPSIRADKNNLYIALLNLISNAIKYASKPHIIINTNLNHNQFYISIKDNGTGIDKKFINKLFKKFYRVPSGDLHNTKGLGLGLYFVQKIVEAHGGRIIVNSIPGIGTEFKIVLPVT